MGIVILIQGISTVMQMAEKYFRALRAHYISVLIAVSLFLFGVSAVQAVITDITDNIYGQAPNVSGEVLVLLPDGHTYLLNNQNINQQLLPSMFSISSETNGLNYHDADGDQISTLTMKNPRLQWLDERATPLTEQQLNQPFATAFSEKDLILVASADIYVASISGLPNTNIVTLQSRYQVRVTAMELQALQIIQDGMLADGKQTNQIQARVINPNNSEPIMGQAVAFSTTNGVVTSALITDEQGFVTASLSSTKAGQALVTARLNEQSHQIMTSFIADRSTATTTLNIIVNNMTANGKMQNVVEARVTDSQGNVLANEPIVFAASNNAVINTAPQTDAIGELKVALTSTKAGSSELTATVPYSGNKQTANVFFHADDNNKLAKITLKTEANGAIADNKNTNRVRAIVTDIYDNPLSGRKVTFTILSGTAAFNSSEQVITSDPLGVADIQLKSSQAGQVTVQAAMGTHFDGSYKTQLTNVTFNPPIDGAL